LKIRIGTLFILNNLILLGVFTAIIYTIYFLDLSVAQIPEAPRPINESFLSIPFYALFFILFTGNLYLYKAKTNDLNMIQLIAIYTIALFPSLCIYLNWMIGGKTEWMASYISYFEIYRVYIHDSVHWTMVIFFGLLYLVSFICVYISRNNHQKKAALQQSIK